MSLENIINEIDNSMEEQKTKINEEYKKKINEVTENCNKKIEEFKREYAIKSEYDKKDIIKQHEDNIKLQSKKINFLSSSH